MRNELGKPHFGLPKRRGTTPLAATAVRAAGTSGVSPTLVKEVAATFLYHTPSTAWQPQRGVGICSKHRAAPRGFTQEELSVVVDLQLLITNGRRRRLRKRRCHTKQESSKAAPAAPCSPAESMGPQNTGPPWCLHREHNWHPLLFKHGLSTPSLASLPPVQEHPPATTLFFASTLRIAPGPAAPLPLALLYIYL